MTQFKYASASQRKKGYFPPETAFCFHYIGLANDEVKNITGRPIFFQNGKYYLSGAGVTLPDAHSILGKEDKSYPLSQEEILSARKLLKNVMISELHEQIKRTYEVQFTSGRYKGKDAKIYLKSSPNERELSHANPKHTLIVMLCKTDFEFCPHFQKRMGEDFFKIQRDTKVFYDNLLSDKTEFDVANILFDESISTTPLPKAPPVVETPIIVPVVLPTLTLQEHYKKVVDVVFANSTIEDKELIPSFSILKVVEQGNTLIITNLQELGFTLENYETAFDEKYTPYLREITKMLGFERLEYVFTAPKIPQPKILQADTVKEIRQIIPELQNMPRGGEVKSLSKLVPKVQYVHSDEKQAHLDHYNMLRKQERADEARIYWEQHPHIFNPQP